MRLYIDLDRNRAVNGVGQREPVSSLEFKRGDSARIEVIFFSGTTVVELTEPASGIFGIKETGKFDAAEFLVSALSWTKEGTGTSTVYVFTPSFNTAELNTLLAHDADDSNDIASVETMLEIEWIENGFLSSTQTITAIIANDVIKEEEMGADPAPTMDAYIAARAVCYDRAQTLDTFQLAQAFENLGIPGYWDLAAANAALGAIGRFYYDQSEHQLRQTTSAS